MNRLPVAAAAAAALGAAVTSTAFADFPLQGPQLTGIALQSFASSRQVVIAVSLASGETIVLRPRAAD